MTQAGLNFCPFLMKFSSQGIVHPIRSFKVQELRANDKKMFYPHFQCKNWIQLILNSSIDQDVRKVEF
jgi:hypothetical protein